MQKKIIERRSVLKGMAAASAVLAAPNIIHAQSNRELNIILITNPFSFTIKEKLAPMFEAKTGMKVNVEITDYGTLHQKSMLDATTGTKQYDIYGLDITFIGRFAAAGALHQVNDPKKDWLKRDAKEFGLKGMIPAGIYNICGVNGKVYGLPSSAYNILAHYRRDLFEKEGVKYPKNWDDHKEVIKHFSRKHNPGSPTEHGVAFMGKRGTPIIHEEMAYHWGFGGSIFGKDPLMFPNFDSKEGIAAAKYYASMKEFAPKGVESYEWGDKTNSFMQGVVPVMMAWSAWGPDLENPEKSQGAGNIEYLPVPTQKGVDFTPFGGWAQCISAKTDKKDEAWEWLKWLNSYDTQVIFANEGTGGPTRWDVLDNKDLQKKFPWFKALSANAKTAERAPKWYLEDYWHFRTRDEYYPDFEDIVGLALNRIVTGDVSAEEGLKQAKKDYYNKLVRGGFYRDRGLEVPVDPKSL
ncbi:MAG: extracellular solute-binding protein [Alphaproteobacteria bacterium]|nr:extracellular solute-binding protein [Alphaproteobacteria bacterium]